MHGYNGEIDEWAYYVYYYTEQKARRSLYERYVANSLGAIARSKLSYDEVLKSFEDKISNKPKRTAKQIRKDLLVKFNRRKDNECI